MAKIGAEIRLRRVRERVSLEELAALTGIGINTLSRLERGIGNTQMKVLLNVLDALGLEIEIKPKRTIYR